MTTQVTPRPPVLVHLVCGGKYHDFDFARLQLLTLLGAHEEARVTVSGDYRETDVGLLEGAEFLVTYTCDVRPTRAEQEALRGWVQRGGRWLALHGTNAALDLTPDGVVSPRVIPVLAETLGSQFIAHPLIAPYKVEVTAPDHPLVAGVAPFETTDELYLSEYHGELEVLLHTRFVGEAPGFAESSWPQERDHPVLYLRRIGGGSVLYLTLGHCRGHYDMRPTTAWWRRHTDGPVAGQFGGNPSLPADVEWPIFSDEEGSNFMPLPFVTSFDCATLPRGILDIDLPTDGHLLFFAEADFFGPRGRVIHVPAGAETSERSATPGEAGFATEVNGCFPLHHSIVWTLPEDSDPTVDRVVLGDESPFFQYKLGDLWWKIAPRADSETQIGGYATKLQVHPAERIPDEQDSDSSLNQEHDNWILLAETNVDEDTFPEALPGILYWMLRRDDMIAKRFDRVEVVMEMRD